MNKFCAACGSQMRPDAAFCPQCGASGGAAVAAQPSRRGLSVGSTAAAIAAGVLVLGGAYLGWAYTNKSGPFTRAALENPLPLIEGGSASNIQIFEATYNGHASALEVQQMAQAHCAQFPIDPEYDGGCFLFISNVGAPTASGDYDSVLTSISPRWDRGEIVAGYILDPDYSGRRPDDGFVIDCDVFDPADLNANTMCKGPDDPISRMLRRHADRVGTEPAM